MATISTPTRGRIGALLRMLGSDHDGEALAAARALRRTLGGVGLDLNDLGDAISRPAMVVPDAPEPKPRRGRKPRQPSPGSVELQPARRRRVVDMLSRASVRGALSSWEAEFCTSVIATLQGSRPRLSARQFEIVERLMLKFGEGASWV